MGRMTAQACDRLTIPGVEHVFALRVVNPVLEIVTAFAELETALDE